MLEFILVSGLLIAVAIFGAVLFVLGFFLKLVFRVLLLPFALLGGLLKVVLLLPLLIVGLVVAPVIFAVFLLLALPILLLMGLFGLGWAVVAA
jgi:hypothetical protein